jgi:Kef-type K+ transport system membrane component KefB
MIEGMEENPYKAPAPFAMTRQVRWALWQIGFVALFAGLFVVLGFLVTVESWAIVVGLPPDSARQVTWPAWIVLSVVSITGFAGAILARIVIRPTTNRRQPDSEARA